MARGRAGCVPKAARAKYAMQQSKLIQLFLPEFADPRSSAQIRGEVEVFISPAMRPADGARLTFAPDDMRCDRPPTGLRGEWSGRRPMGFGPAGRSWDLLPDP